MLIWKDYRLGPGLQLFFDDVAENYGCSQIDGTHCWGKVNPNGSCRFVYLGAIGGHRL